MNNFKIDKTKYEFQDPVKAVFKTPKGLNKSVIREISRQHDEPEWMLEKRLKALDIFLKTPMPDFGGDLSDIDFDDISKAGIAAIDNKNLNEVNIISKKINKSGFFEKLFHIFS